MSWQVTVTIDPGQVDVGLVTLIWTDPDGSVFTASRRSCASVDMPNVGALIAQAVVERNAWQAGKASEANYADQIKAALVAAGEGVS